MHRSSTKYQTAEIVKFVQFQMKMMKTYHILVLLFIFLAGTVGAQSEIDPNGYNKFYYEDSTLSSEGMMRDGKPDGYWKTYYESGILKSEGNRKDFLLDSTWKFYDEDGELKLMINYENGMKNGLRITYREKEIIAENFENDIKQGLTTYYYPDSTIYKTINFVDGREDGLAKEYTEDGRVVTLTTFRKGFVVSRERINRLDAQGRKQGLWKFFHENGEVRLEGKYTNDLRDGYFKEYDEDGRLLATTKWVEGEKQENATELVRLEVLKDYYPDGSIKTLQTYRNGVPHGVRREYDREGNITAGYLYDDGGKVAEGITREDGVKEGEWKHFFKDGFLRAEGKYNDGKKVGKWVYYHPNGKIEQTGNYDQQGRLQGRWVWYYPSGEILREENYIDGLADGLMTEYREDGSIIAEGEYIEGMEEGPWIFQYGDHREEGSYSYGLRNGIWKYYYPDGSLRFEGEFIDGNPNGKHLYYWDNGNIKDEINYLMGMKDGEWRKYNYDGTLLLVITYDNGVEIKYDGIKIDEPFVVSSEDME